MHLPGQNRHETLGNRGIRRKPPTARFWDTPGRVTGRRQRRRSGRCRQNSAASANSSPARAVCNGTGSASTLVADEPQPPLFGLENPKRSVALAEQDFAGVERADGRAFADRGGEEAQSAHGVDSPCAVARCAESTSGIDDRARRATRSPVSSVCGSSSCVIEINVSNRCERIRVVELRRRAKV